MKVKIEVEIEDSRDKNLREDEAVKATLDRLEGDYQKALAKVVGAAQIAVGEGDCE